MVGKTNWASDEWGDWQTGYEPQQKKTQTGQRSGAMRRGAKSHKKADKDKLGNKTVPAALSGHLRRMTIPRTAQSTRRNAVIGCGFLPSGS